MRSILSVFLLFVTTYAFAQSPGDVSGGLRWWLKANANVYSNAGTTLATNGTTVRQWNDRSGNANNASQATAGNRPTYYTNRINGYPALSFNGDQFLTAGAAPGISSNESFYMFLVFKQDSYLLGGVGDDQGSFLVDRSSATQNLMSFKMVTGSKYNYQKRSDSGGNIDSSPVSATTAPTGIFTIIDYYRIFNNSFGIYIDGRQDVTSTANTSDAITGPTLQIGRHVSTANQGLIGEFAEIALYDDNLTTAERQQIESYFAIKYGITLDTTPAQDYYNSGGTRIFPAANTAAYTPYRYDVAGIIRDDDSGLTQSTSHSQNTDYVVTVSNPSSLNNDNDALVWGSNNGDLTTPNTTDVNGTTIKRRLSRVWRFRETGEIGTVTISFDLSSVPGAKSQASLRLLIDTDDDGFADNNSALTGTLSGNVITFTGVTINSNYNLTIGTTDVSTSPLPVELVSFNVQYQEPVVQATWKTASELNNSHFLIERSSEDLGFEEIGRVQGHGTTVEPQSYSFTDYLPVQGRSYYRLKQVDYDGMFDYSPVKTVYAGSVSGELLVWPNPLKEPEVKISFGSREMMIHFIELVDEQGRIVHRQQSGFTFDDAYHFTIPAGIRNGLYVLRVGHDGKVESRRLSIMR